jgi:hypothetical protein
LQNANCKLKNEVCGGKGSLVCTSAVELSKRNRLESDWLGIGAFDKVFRAGRLSLCGFPQFADTFDAG